MNLFEPPPSAEVKLIQDKISSAKLHILNKNIISSIPAGIVCGLIIYYGLEHTGYSSLHRLWLGCFMLSCVFRLICAAWFLRRPKNLAFHLKLFVIGTFCTAILFGISGSLLMPANNLIIQMMIIIILGGISAGAVQAFQPYFLINACYSFFSLFPLIFWVFTRHDATYFMVGLALITYYIFVTLTAWRGYNLLNQSLLLYFQNMKLVDEVSVINKGLALMNGALQRHEEEMSQINKMNASLQLCKSTTEAYVIISLTAQKVFLGLNGGLTIFNDSIQKQELVASWTDVQLMKPQFASDECLALRHNALHIVSDLKNNSMCEHFKITPCNGYICFPLIIDGNLVGIMNFSARPYMSISNYQKQIITTFSEVIKLALANINSHLILHEQATQDPLTGLFNRRYLNDTLPRELMRIQREDKRLCLAMLDLDHFKQLNDTFGHDAGDEVLKFIGCTLKKNFRGSDIACRLGGEEFVVVLVDTDLTNSLMKMEMIRSEIRTAQLCYQNIPLPKITVSIGIIEASQDEYSLTDMFRQVDEALYTAKRAGRDRINIGNANH